LINRIVINARRFLPEWTCKIGLISCPRSGGKKGTGGTDGKY
jgi:hypothetical protein